MFSLWLAHSQSFTEWTIINKTLEAVDKAHPVAVVEAPKPAPRTLPPVPRAFPDRPSTHVPTPAIPRHSSATPPVASSSRPSIKLKVGSQNKKPERPQQTKPPKRKPKLSDSPTNLILDAPPPPYVDDGSHDILQEVLAIEREKNEQRQRSVNEKDKPTANSMPGKRKKSDSLDEDDILALATPAKKERPTPPGPTSGTKNHAAPPASTSKLPTVSVKAKKERPDLARPSASVDSPMTSVKGKEREVVPASPAPIPPKPRKPVQATPINEKKCKDLLKVLQKLPDAAIFLRPVDSVLDGCPTYVQYLYIYMLVAYCVLTRYYDEILRPMDFGTMSTKLNEGKYATMEDFKEDMELVFSNCRQFNPPGTMPVACAAAVEKAFKKEWPKAMERKLSWTEKRGLQSILSNIGKEQV